MAAFDFVLLYVTDTARSADFYADLFGLPVIDRAPTFAMLRLRDGVMLGLWRHDDVEPASRVTPGGGEIAFIMDDAAALDARCAAWKARGISILQEPADMDFGRTFTVADPDGHRIRLYVSARR